MYTILVGRTACRVNTRGRQVRSISHGLAKILQDPGEGKDCSDKNCGFWFLKIPEGICFRSMDVPSKTRKELFLLGLKFLLCNQAFVASPSQLSDPSGYLLGRKELHTLRRRRSPSRQFRRETAPTKEL